MHQLPSREELDQAAQIVYANMAPTPQYPWTLLRDRMGFETWIKHENHTPTAHLKCVVDSCIFLSWSRASPTSKA